jgi:hypothetical protein
MVEVSGFSLEQHGGPYDSWPFHSKLYIYRMWTGSVVRGYLIERQYQLRSGYLLITSDDCPFEETTHFTLLDGRYRVLSHKKLFLPYYSFLLASATPLDGQRLRVTFASGDEYMVHVQDTGLLSPSLKLQRLATT